MGSRLRSIAAFVVLLLATGCSRGEEGRRLELGRDDASVYTPISEGEDLAIVRGPQGGVHLPLAVRSDVASGNLVKVEVTLTRLGDATPFAVSRFLLQFDGPMDGDGFREETGLFAVLPSVDSGAGHDVKLSATLDDGPSDEHVVHCLPPEET